MSVCHSRLARLNNNCRSPSRIDFAVLVEIALIDDLGMRDARGTVASGDGKQARALDRTETARECDVLLVRERRIVATGADGEAVHRRDHRGKRRRIGRAVHVEAGNLGGEARMQRPGGERHPLASMSRGALPRFRRDDITVSRARWTGPERNPIYRAMHGAAFIKMHGLGNDFVVLDMRAHALAIDGAAARAIADRHRGVGCDQLVLIEKPQRDGAAAFMRIRNADGGEAEACGNAARCVAALLMRESGARSVTHRHGGGPVAAQACGDGEVTVDMGTPRLDWRDIPLARAADTLHVPLAAGPLGDAVCTSLGNPHATFFVADAEAVDLAALGPRLEHDPLFPERANIGVAQVLAPRPASGSGCGSAAPASRPPAAPAPARRWSRRTGAASPAGAREVDRRWRRARHRMARRRPRA